MSEIVIDKDQVSDLFYYDTSSPTCLRYKKYNNGHGDAKKFADDVAGCLERKNGYFSVTLNGKTTRVHRIICALHGFDIAGKQVDHIDGNKTNNNIENLRIVSLDQNARNHKLRCTNKTGVQGVHIKKERRSKETKEYAKTKVTLLNKQVIEKIVSINQNGYQMAVALAAHWRAKTLIMLNELGAGYTDRHIGTAETEKAKGGAA